MIFIQQVFQVLYLTTREVCKYQILTGLTFASCDGRELSNFVVGIWDENCIKVDLFLVTDLASRANLLKPENTRRSEYKTNTSIRYCYINQTSLNNNQEPPLNIWFLQFN